MYNVGKDTHLVQRSSHLKSLVALVASESIAMASSSVLRYISTDASNFHGEGWSLAYIAKGLYIGEAEVAIMALHSAGLVSCR